MADTVVEFINTTGKTYSELATGVNVLTNTSTEQAVVKDIYVTNESSRGINVNVNGNTLYNVTSSAKLSGSELVGASKSMTVTTNSIAAGNQFIQYNSSSSFSTYEFSTVFTNSAPIGAQSTASTLGSFSPTTTVTPNFVAFGANGDFYYSNASTGSLYRRAGGVNGSQSTITAYGMCPSFDGRYIYGFQNNNASSFVVIDTQNNGSLVTRSVTGALGSPNSSGAWSAAIDGFVWIHPDYTDVAYLLNGTTGAGVLLGGIDSATAGRYGVGIGKATNGDYIAIQLTSYTNRLYWWNFGSSLSTPYIKASGARTIGATSSSNNCNNIYRSPTSNSILFVADASQTHVVDVSSGGTPSVYNFNTTDTNTALNAGSLRIVLTSPTKAGTDFGTVNIRATGIKTT